MYYSYTTLLSYLIFFFYKISSINFTQIVKRFRTNTYESSTNHARTNCHYFIIIFTTNTILKLNLF